MSRRSRNLAIGAVVAVVVGLVVSMGREVARRGRFAVPLSSYSTASAGTKALSLLAAARGHTVRRWTRDLTHLPQGRGVLVAVGDPFGEPARPLGRAEADALDRWVHGGGTIVILGAASYLPGSFGVDLSEPAGAEPKDALSVEERRRRKVMPWDDPVVLARVAARNRVVTAQLAPGGIAAGLSELRLTAPGHLRTTFGEWERVATSPKDDLVLVRAKGKGHVAIVASASFVTNEELAALDHAALALRLLALGRGPVLLDEYHLGMGSTDSLLRTLVDRGFLATLLQAVLVALLVLWRAGARFGRPRPPAPAEAADVTAYVDAVGRIYEHAGDAGASMERLAAHALGRVAARHGVQGTAPAALAGTLRARGRAGAAAAVDAVSARLARARVAAKGARGKDASRALVDFARGLDDDLSPALCSTPTPARPPSTEAHE